MQHVAQLDERLSDEKCGFLFERLRNHAKRISDHLVQELSMLVTTPELTYFAMSLTVKRSLSFYYSDDICIAYPCTCISS